MIGRGYRSLVITGSVTALAGLALLAATLEQPPIEPFSEWLPDVRFGMSREALEAARPAALRFSLDDEEVAVGDRELYFEELTGPLGFEIARYLFDGNALCGVSLSATPSNPSYDQVLENIFRRMLARWGNEFSRHINVFGAGASGFASVPDEPRRAALLWTHPAVQVSIVHTRIQARPEEQDKIPPDVLIYIETQAGCPERPALNLVEPTDIERAQLFETIDRLTTAKAD